MSIKLVVSGSSKESRISLVGRTGKELLASATFTEPRAKGATLRALKKIFGSDVVVEDATITNGRIVSPVPDPETEPAAAPTPARSPRKQAAASVRGRTTTVAAKLPAASKSTKRSAKAGQAG